MPRLAERLARLETARCGDGGVAVPPDLLRVLAVVIAIDLGGYLQPREIRQERDTIGDAFARGLGLANRDAFDTMIAVAPSRWDALIMEAFATLIHRRDPERVGVIQDATQAWCWLLDRLAALHVERPDLDWMRLDADLSRLSHLSDPEQQV